MADYENRYISTLNEIVSKSSRDERLLSEINFAQDQPVEKREELQKRVREVLTLCGVKTAQDIVDLGCTGLANKLALARIEEPELIIHDVVNIISTEIRPYMSGSMCGLPCYIVRRRFCLIHNTIGGLQDHQVNPYSSMLYNCSRELTPKERLENNIVQEKMQQDAADKAEELFHGEVISEESVTELDCFEGAISCPLPEKVDPAPQVFAFICSKHQVFDPGCVYCLAQSIAKGSCKPKILIRSYQILDDVEYEHTTVDVDLEDLPKMLAKSDNMQSIELYVLAGYWVKELVKKG
jgi:hypothetical protein